MQTHTVDGRTGETLGLRRSWWEGTEFRDYVIGFLLVLLIVPAWLVGAIAILSRTKDAICG